MKIDVLIPVASPSIFVKDAVYSAIRQAGDKNIFLIENNIGNPEYSSYLKNLAEECSVEYVYCDVRLPMFENWQRCLQIGKSEWIAFLHDDDVWSADYFETFSRFAHTADILFFEFRYFEGVPPVLDLKSDSVVTTMESREALLAKMLCTNHHVSSTVFKRDLSLDFPVPFKMIGDQYAYRECVARNKDIRVSWVAMSCPNLIRVHPNQVTWSGALLYAAWENAISYRTVVQSISSESINIEKFCKELLNRCTNVDLSRILSAILFRKPYFFSIKISTSIFISKRSVKLALTTLLRSVAQDLVWSVKLLLARFCSTKP